MVCYSSVPITAEKAPLLPMLTEYLLKSPPKNADARQAALSLLAPLSERTGLPVAFPIRTDENGRPFFDAEGAPDFNLSHTGALAAAILGSCRVGIDVQEELITLPIDRLAARFFSQNEQERLRSATHELFFELWTKKEALGKLLGKGLPPLLGKDTDAVANAHGVFFVTERIFIDGKSYTISACATEPIEHL